MMADRLLKLYKPNETILGFDDEVKWVKHFRKLCKAIKAMEQGAVQLATKLGSTVQLNELTDHLKVLFVMKLHIM